MRLPFALLLLLSFTALSQEAGQENYVLNTGDVVKIRVFGEPDLSPEARIGERGTIPFPFLGELRVAGLTTEDLASTITDGLKGPYLINPRVSVTIEEYRSFFLNGEVNSPGSYQWEPGMTIRKAVALAGGLSDYASTRKIFLRKEDQPAEDRSRVSIDHPVGPGDIITIEQSFF
ncbi:MAG: polysaccharide biosynthesis/export family protein [Pseudomonadota bacterium]